jgi:hypothetical protein
MPSAAQRSAPAQARLEDRLFGLEERFWTEGADYYAGNLAATALMVFPEPTGVLVKDEIASSLGAATRWAEVALEEHRLLELDASAVMLTYKATALRPGAEPYVARASSAYVFDGHAWKLAFHQQTPATP